MTIQYLTDKKGRKTGVLLSMKDWEDIQKKLNTDKFYTDFSASLAEIKLDQQQNYLKDASEIFA
ncbi:MAG: hypothetical protein H7257_07295 [Taibaiella sp.]|nr:hypothetical protein [Taibaiella sp.]